MTVSQEVSIYNSISRTKEVFVPLESGKIRMYVCGPTVYDYIHIGNARPLVVFDVVQKYLRAIGYDVRYVVNFTDVDDKLIRKAEQLGCTVPEVADRFIAAFEEDIVKLGVAKADIQPRVTEHIGQIVDFVDGLVQRGFAYSKEGDVYFRTDRFADYGKLSNQDLEALQHGARIDVNEKKENSTDFVLWKAAKPGEISWSSPWGEGRPGWHIECSAMAKQHLGETIDIHGGGHDLMFPHHECEVAQSEALHGEPLSRYWMHNGYIQINQEKMSKSLGNGILVRGIMENTSTPAFRYFMLGSHYRSPLNFSDDAMVQAKASVDRIANARLNVRHRLSHLQRLHSDNASANANVGEPSEHAHDIATEQAIEAAKARFHQNMGDDFNTPDALTAVFEVVNAANQYLNQRDDQLSTALLAQIDQTFEWLESMLGICPAPADQASDDPEIARIEALVAARTEARSTKNWARADEIRNELNALNFVVEDTAQGPRWVRK